MSRAVLTRVRDEQARIARVHALAHGQKLQVSAANPRNSLLTKQKAFETFICEKYIFKNICTYYMRKNLIQNFPAFLYFLSGPKLILELNFDLLEIFAKSSRLQFTRNSRDIRSTSIHMKFLRNQVDFNLPGNSANSGRFQVTNNYAKSGRLRFSRIFCEIRSTSIPQKFP